MPPRLSLRRAFLCVLCCGGVLLLVSVHQKWPWLPAQGPTLQAHIQLPTLASQPTPRTHSTEAPKELPAKHWYLTGGNVYPSNFKGTPRLFPEQDNGDRISDQLMYVPEDYEGNRIGREVCFEKY